MVLNNIENTLETHINRTLGMLSALTVVFFLSLYILGEYFYNFLFGDYHLLLSSAHKSKRQNPQNASLKQVS